MEKVETIYASNPLQIPETLRRVADTIESYPPEEAAFEAVVVALHRNEEGTAKVEVFGMGQNSWGQGLNSANQSIVLLELGKAALMDMIGEALSR